MTKIINNRFTRAWPPLFFLPMIWLLAACSSQQDPVKTESILITLQTSKDVNPNEKGQANPVRVTLYQLKQTDAFTMSDYFTLQDMTDAELNTQLEKSATYIMAPGEKKELTLKINDAVSALGVITAYRDIDRAQWRAVYLIPSQPRQRWYAKLWPVKIKWQPKAMVNIGNLSTSIEKVE